MSEELLHRLASRKAGGIVSGVMWFQSDKRHAGSLRKLYHPQGENALSMVHGQVLNLGAVFDDSGEQVRNACTICGEHS